MSYSNTVEVGGGGGGGGGGGDIPANQLVFQKLEMAINLHFIKLINA